MAAAPRLQIVFALLLALGLAGAALPAHAQQIDPAAAASMTARLAAELAAADAPVDFLVILRDQIDPLHVVAQSSAAQGTTKQRAAVLYDALRSHAAATQASLRAWLAAQAVPYRPFYIVNMIQVRGDAALAEALLARPEVARLAANPPAQGVQEAVADTAGPLPAGWSWAQGAASARSDALPWGLEATHAPALWAQGIDGSGIVVASQDTGVQWDHVALKQHYRGWDAGSGTADHRYNWYDAFGLDSVRQSRCSGEAASNAQVPCDDHGHGTHTVGTMVGDATPDGGTVLGMAPGAQWIGCRNMSAGVGTPASYTACFEFFLAPYPQGGDPFSDGRPDLAPHIINNSWGCPPSEGCDDPGILRGVVETARAAGQFVAASAGNNGSSCSTIIDPIGIYDEVFSVGALNSSGMIAGFSSRGPVTIDGSGRIKPDISAPGGLVFSSEPVDSYGYLSGTSMASPHVAGAVALLWSAAPDLIGDIDATEAILRESATPVPWITCGPQIGSDRFNSTYGAGRLDVAAALALYRSPPTLSMTVRDRDGAALGGVPVEVEDVRNQLVYSGQTGEDGTVDIPVYSGQWTGSAPLVFLLDEGEEVRFVVNTPYRTFWPQVSSR